jgi:hypothetical protein
VDAVELAASATAKAATRRHRELDSFGTLSSLSRRHGRVYRTFIRSWSRRYAGRMRVSATT